MDNVVESIFGLSPAQIQQRQNVGMMTAANNYASQDPLQRAAASMFAGGGMLAGAGAQAAGMMTPEMQQAQRTQAIMASGGDLQTSAGLKAIAAKFYQSGDQQRALVLLNEAKKREADEAKAMLAQRQATLAERKQEFTETEAFELKRREANARIAHAEAVLAQKTSSDAEKLAATKEKNQWMYLLGQMQASAKGNQPPKNLTREARLKWELEDGRIDQETYDAAMAATPGAKLLTEQTGAARTAELGFKSVEDNISKLYDPKTKEIKPEANALFGKYDQYRPQIAMSQETIDAANALDSLTNQVMMANLADAKERVGQSFGSMQVQEWDKFTQQLISLKRGLSPKAAGEAMDYVNNFIQTKRGILKTAMGKSGVPAANQGGIEKWERDASGKLVRVSR